LKTKIILLYIAAIILFTGCTNGGGGPVGLIDTEQDFEQMLKQAWELYTKEQYDQAIVQFNEVRRQNPGEHLKDESTFGIGISHMKKGDFQKAEEYFSQVQTGTQELYIARASIKVLGNTQQDFKEALLHLKTASIDDIQDTYTPYYPLNITRVYCYALAGIVYYYNGIDTEARKHLEMVGKNPDYSFDNRLKRIYDAITKDLGL
jgi:tetratricopeptide (TPR) repeat protein